MFEHPHPRGDSDGPHHVPGSGDGRGSGRRRIGLGDDRLATQWLPQIHRASYRVPVPDQATPDGAASLEANLAPGAGGSMATISRRDGGEGHSTPQDRW